MKILGIDYGTRRIGVALGDQETRVAVPLEVIRIKKQELRSQEIIKELKKIVKREDVELIVVGLPIRTDGRQSALQKKVEHFIQNLQVALNVIIVTQDERFTSQEVEQVMRNYGKARKGIDKDSAAAALILQSWLERKS